MRINPPRPLNADERRVLAALLSGEFGGSDELRGQAESVKVIGQCDCGCPTIELNLPPEVPSSPVSTSNRLAPVEGRITSEEGEPVGDILLLVDEGRLTSLELVWYTDQPPTAWPRSTQIRVERTDAA